MNNFDAIKPFVKEEIIEKFKVVDDKELYLNQLMSVLTKESVNFDLLSKITKDVNLDRSCDDLPESIVEVKECINLDLFDKISAGVALVKNHNTYILKCFPDIIKYSLIKKILETAIKTILLTVVSFLSGFVFTIFMLSVKLAIVIRYIYLAYKKKDIGKRSGYIGAIAGIIVRSLINPNSIKMRKMRKSK
jgi:hypothetical protein